MLQFVLGKPSSGKTTFFINKIRKLSTENKKSVLIVPEQFTFETERLLLKELGDSASINTTVLSFSRLCDEVGRERGGIAAKVLEDSDKIIFMSRALRNLKDKLVVWKKYSGSVSFAKTILDTIGEFKINACTPQDLLLAEKTVTNLSLKAKLKELAEIYAEYDLLISEKFIDPADRLTILDNALKDYKYFENKNVFFDSFKGFTGQQYKIIKRILGSADNVYFSFTYNNASNEQYGIFSNIRQTINKIKKYAKSFNLEIREPKIFENSHFNGSSIKITEEILGSGMISKNAVNDGSVIIKQENNIYGEAEAVATTIKYLVRTNGYRYRDFVIIARDADICSDAVLSACKKNDIKCFYDKRIPLTTFICAVAVEKAIDALILNSNDILSFNKTGLGKLTYDEIALLENYVYIWNIDGDNWLSEWTMNPNGFSNESDNIQNYKEELEKLNRLRLLAIEPIINFKNDFKGNVKGMVTAIFKLFENCNIKEKLLELSQTLDDNSDYDLNVLSAAYDMYINILNSLVRCYENTDINIAEFRDSLKLSVSLATVGIIPQTLDEVTFGSADRIRALRPKIAFIIGSNHGTFPKLITNKGILNCIERKVLIENGIEISDNGVKASIDENFMVYCNLCSPSDRLYLYYSSQTISGEALEPSSFIIKIMDALKEAGQPIRESEDILPESEDTLFSLYCNKKLTDINFAETLKIAAKGSNIERKIEFLDNTLSFNKEKISNETAATLYGKHLKLSATKFDTFNRCRFSYFCRYGLLAKKLRPVDFDAIQRGTVVHYVLERLITEYSDRLYEISDIELENLTDKFINEYLDGIAGYRDFETAKTKFLVSRISRSLKEVVQHIRQELVQSKFKPVSCELGIGTENSDINVVFPFDGGEISLVGSIDRVDEYNGFIRIIDYKTGSKTFKLPDILFGLNLQMLIYLYAVIRGQGLPDNCSAGILYQPSKRDINSQGLAMNGLLQLNTELYFAMDNSGLGEYVPKLNFKNDGSIGARNNSFIDAEDFSEIFDYIELLMSKTGNSILNGDISINPTDGRESPACTYCEFSTICGFERSNANVVPPLKNNEVIERIKEVKSNGF